MPKLSSKAEETTQGLGGYLLPAKHLIVPAVWDQAEVFSQDDLLDLQSCSLAILEFHPGGGGISPG